jgi:dihydroorotate dehydrogenase electron transfer subunit
VSEPPAATSGSAGAVVRDCRVAEMRHYGDYVRITLIAPDLAERSQPGQFAMVGVPTPGFHLRRPLSLHRVQADRVSLLLQVRGGGTSAIAAAQVGDTLSLSGPIGNAFPAPGVRQVLLVGGGIGAAPLQFLADRLASQGVTVAAAFGFRDHRHARLAHAFELEPLWLATDDGSQGSGGTVLDLLAHVPLQADTVVYACGPLAMLAALQDWTQQRGLTAFASVEAHMACGTGVCHGCVLPTAQGYARACAEGPVFPLSELVFP